MKPPGKLPGKPPRARQVPVEHELHGTRWTDEFSWMRADNWQACVDEPELLPEVIRDYLNQTKTPGVKPIWRIRSGCRQRLLGEMRGRMQADDDSLPDEEGPWKYFERYLGDDEYPSYWRIPRQTSASSSPAAVKDASTAVQGSDSEQLLIDFNVEADRP